MPKEAIAGFVRHLTVLEMHNPQLFHQRFLGASQLQDS